ncbi:MAG TPA: STAS domain-containing protein [Acidimicrobiia bacterium]
MLSSETPSPDETLFRCLASTTDRVATVRLEGDLDLANASLVRLELLATVEQDIDRLVVDLRALTFMDSSGIGALVVVWKRAGEREVAMTLEAVPLEVRRVLDSCGLNEMFEPRDADELS